MRRLLLFCCLLTLAATSLYTQADPSEQITDYRVYLELNKDRSIRVRETITVKAAGQQIQRGITRAFPTGAVSGGSSSQRYNIRSVKRDGREEPYHTKEQGSNLILYIGDKDIVLPPGTYKYQIEYSSPERVTFLDSLDEITWNAIGLDNRFPIQHAECTIVLPNGVQPTQQACYTGRYGSRDNACTTEITGSEEVHFASTASLQPGEGLTVSVGFDKGQIDPPGWFSRQGGLLAVILGGLSMLFYGFTSWRKHGVDPPKPAVYPLWEPPQDYSPASIGYLTGKGNQTKLFTASIIALATKGYLRIEMDKEGFLIKSPVYQLIKTDTVPQDGQLPAEQQKLYNLLFSKSDSVEIKKKYDSKLKGVYNAHQRSLTSQYEKFIWEGHNLTRVLPLLGIFIATIIGGFMLAGLPGASGVKLAVVAFIPLGIIGLFLYAYLINKPTTEKLKLRSEIAGFKQYLR
ncbi:MAG: DUF2207 domain-containing protein, partial [Bacteroidota bacterium]